MLLYGSEAWVLTQVDEAALGVFERKIIRKIYGSICVDGEYRHRMNHELYQLFSDIDIVRHIELQRLRWLVHVVRMDEDAPAQKAYKSEPADGSRRRPRIRWKDQVEDNIAEYGLSNWKNCTKERRAWKSFLSSAYGTKVLSQAS